MNRKQKFVIKISVLIIIILILVWLVYGAEIFTKTQVLIETKDDLFGWSEKKWEDKFIWGLDLSLLLAGVTILIGGVLFFVFRNKKQVISKL